MASPAVATRNEGAVTTAGTSHAIAMPSGITAGDLLVVIFGTAVILDVTNTQTFTEFYGGVSTNFFGFVKQAAGGDTLTITTGSSTKSAHTSYRITGAADPAVQLPEFDEATGTSATPDPDPISPTGGSKDYLFLVGLNQAGEEADDDTWANSAPSGYSNLLQKTSGTGGAANTNCSVASAERAATTATENPGTWSVDQSLAYVSVTIAIHPAGPAAPPSRIWPRRTLVTLDAVPRGAVR